MSCTSKESWVSNDASERGDSFDLSLYLDVSQQDAREAKKDRSSLKPKINITRK